jgi:hypothetical protein
VSGIRSAWRGGRAVPRARPALAALLAASTLAIASCGGTSGVDDRLVADTDDGEFVPDECGLGGSFDDLELEPAQWLDEREYVRWQDVDGCPVRVDVVGHVYGDIACGWERVEFIAIGWPVGTSYAGAATEHRYYWDPDGLLGEIAPPTSVMPRSDMPMSASDTGFRLDGMELWVDALDENRIFRITGEDVEVWPRDIDGTIRCG